MKKFRIIPILLICVILCVGLFSPLSASAANFDSSPLQNVYHRLTVDQELTIGYIGGSITDGSGATNKETDSWRARTTAWFKSQFPDATITEKDMSIGGTGSIFALYRMERALLDLEGDAPDLVFIDTAINDSYDGISSNDMRKYMESLVKKLYAKNPKCNIVMVITGDITTMKQSHESGVAFRKEHRDIAEHYDIPIVDVGAGLYQKMYEENSNEEITSSENEVWKKYFKDTVHPLNAGHKVYADILGDFLANELLNKTLNPTDYTNAYIPSSNYTQELLIDAYDVDFSNFDFSKNNNFRTDYRTFDSITYKRLTSSRKGNTFTVKFTGATFGIWTMANSVFTNINYSIDGNAEQELQIYRASSNLKVYILADNLSEGEHTIRITHADSNNTLEIYSMFIAGDPTMSADVSFVSNTQNQGNTFCDINGHKLGDWEVVKKAYCETDGEEISKCSNSGCNYSETREIKATGHNFKDTTITKKPTCTEQGEETGICTVCNLKSSKAIETISHSWGKWREFSKANCTDKGIQNRTCSVCKSVESRYTSLGAHIFAEPELSVKPTLYSNGIESGKCLYCDDATSQETTCGATDKETGISIQNEMGVFDEGAVLRVKEITDEDKLFGALSGVLEGKFKAYYVAALLNKQEQQPNGQISLSLPIPNGFDENSDLYYIDSVGKTKKLDAVVDINGTSFTATVDKLGTFAFCNSDTSNSATDISKTSNVVLWIIVICSVVALAAIITVSIILIKKKKNA